MEAEELEEITRKIAEEILETAKIVQLNPSIASSDLVATIHGLWIRIGLELGKEMERIRWEEKHGKSPD